MHQSFKLVIVHVVKIGPIETSEWELAWFNISLLANSFWFTPLPVEWVEPDSLDTSSMQLRLVISFLTSDIASKIANTESKKSCHHMQILAINKLDVAFD